MAAKHIGIVAVSAEGAALCYRTICAEGAAILGAHDHPQVTMHTFPLAAYLRHIDAGAWPEVELMLLASARKLIEGGAQLLICPDNTVHQALDPIRERVSVPWLHIAEVVGAEAAQRRYRRLGILGTRFLMEGPVYPAKLRRLAIESEIPEPADRELVNRIIFDQLVYGQLQADSRVHFQRVIDRLAARGCDAVVLGCTEIPLLISDADSSLPTLDSTRTLARAALAAATASTPRS